MGTNYFGRITPTKKRKDEIKQAIDSNDFSLIKNLVTETYGDLTCSWDNQELIGGIVHLGKASWGWKFLWNPNIYLIRNGHTEYIEDKDGFKHGKYVIDPDTAKYLYPLTKEGIKAFIDREDIEIYDECGEKQDKEEFFQMALNKATWKDPKTGKKRPAWDADAYDEEHPKEQKWSCKNDYTNLLEAEGFTLSKYKSDFYSDGLRFATTTDFS